MAYRHKKCKRETGKKLQKKKMSPAAVVSGADGDVYVNNPAQGWLSRGAGFILHARRVVHDGAENSCQTHFLGVLACFSLFFNFEIVNYHF